MWLKLSRPVPVPKASVAALSEPAAAAAPPSVPPMFSTPVRVAAVAMVSPPPALRTPPFARVTMLVLPLPLPTVTAPLEVKLDPAPETSRVEVPFAPPIWMLGAVTTAPPSTSTSPLKIRTWLPTTRVEPEPATCT